MSKRAKISHTQINYIQEICALIDRSGSMLGKEMDTIGGINETFRVLRETKQPNEIIKISKISSKESEKTKSFFNSGNNSLPLVPIRLWPSTSNNPTKSKSIFSMAARTNICPILPVAPIILNLYFLTFNFLSHKK